MQGNDSGKLMLCLEIKEKEKSSDSNKFYMDYTYYPDDDEDLIESLERTICDQEEEIERLNERLKLLIPKTKSKRR